MPYFRPLTLWLAVSGCAVALASPPPGSIYREYSIGNLGDRDWRVTDPEARHEGARKFLPNPVLRLEIGDLDQAIRAEAVLVRWGGHPGTSRKRFRINGGPWIAIPEPGTVAAPLRPECVMYQDNPVAALPLEYLKPGVNTIEGSCSGQICHDFGWGQWGWDAILIRVFYAPSKPHPSGRITHPRSGFRLEENPELAAVARGPRPITRVDFLAWYEGHDENGDGIFLDRHHAYQFNRRSPPPLGKPEISGHAGTAIQAPFRTRWDTRWVPDQEGIQILARIQDASGMWYVTEPVKRLSLSRSGFEVRFYKPAHVPESFWVRAGRKASSTVLIPASEPFGRAVDAAVHLRTWNGAGEHFRLNGHVRPIGGGDHIFAETIVLADPASLKEGENRFEFWSDTDHHGPEILWPGPSLIVRYRK